MIGLIGWSLRFEGRKVQLSYGNHWELCQEHLTNMMLSDLGAGLKQRLKIVLLCLSNIYMTTTKKVALDVLYALSL